MKFQSYDLKQRKRGEIVLVTLSGNAANVKLMDNYNFSKYCLGRKHKYYGGHARKSPIRLIIPKNGHWYITIDLGGYKGRFRSSIKILPGFLPTFKDKPLSSVPTLVQRQNKDDEIVRKYDVFISHATEEKYIIVRPLANLLKNAGLKVWYDEFELKIGDSLRRKIDKGLSNSRFGVVVLSKYFFKKGWTNYELDGLVTRSVTSEQILLPIWHNISKQEVIEYSPSLADKVARNTSTNTIEEIALEIAELIKEYAS